MTERPRKKTIDFHLRAGMLLWLALAVLPVAGWAHLEPGSPAPDFTLPSLNREKPLHFNSLSTYRLLVFVRSDQRFTSNVISMGERILRHVTLSKDRWQPVWIWEGSQPPMAGGKPVDGQPGKAWWIVRDSEGSVARSYAMLVSPLVYLIGPDGKVNHVFPGWNPLLESNILDAIAHDLGKNVVTEVPEPVVPGEGPKAKALLYFNLARALADQGHWEESLTQFDRGLALDSTSAQVLAEAARAAWVAGERNKAKSYSDRALSIDPNTTLAQAVQSNLEGHPAPLGEGLRPGSPQLTPPVSGTSTPESRTNPTPGASR